MAYYKPTTAKYVGRTRTLYIVYPEKHIHTYRGGVRHRREQTRVKRVYIPGEYKGYSGPGLFTARSGRQVWGIKIWYENPVSGGIWRRGSTRYRMPRKRMIVEKIVPLPSDVREVRVTGSPPRGPLMDIT